MSLVALTHRRLATVSAGSLTIAALLDAIWAVVDPTVTTYSDGSARAFTGAGATGWTWTRYQNAGVTEALYATPANGTMNQRVILAGRATAPTPSPTMISPDSFASAASQLLISHQLGAGADGRLADDTGMDALGMAKEAGHAGVVRVLEEWASAAAPAEL